MTLATEEFGVPWTIRSTSVCRGRCFCSANSTSPPTISPTSTPPGSRWSQLMVQDRPRDAGPRPRHAADQLCAGPRSGAQLRPRRPGPDRQPTWTWRSRARASSPCRPPTGRATPATAASPSTLPARSPTSSGNAILSAGGSEITVDPANGAPSIAKDGTSSARPRPQGQTVQVGKIGVVRFADLTALSKEGGNLYSRPPPARPRGPRHRRPDLPGHGGEVQRPVRDGDHPPDRHHPRLRAHHQS